MEDTGVADNIPNAAEMKAVKHIHKHVLSGVRSGVSSCVTLPRSRDLIGSFMTVPELVFCQSVMNQADSKSAP